MSRETLSRSAGLCQLVLMMGKTKIKTAAVDIELIAQILTCHSRALQMPSRTSAAPRRRPTSGLWLAVLVTLPQSEVAGIPLAAWIGVSGWLHVVDVLVR
jgi:hypothetical protein